jgi:hypothetical protein
VLLARIVREITERPWEMWGAAVPALVVLAGERDPLELAWIQPEAGRLLLTRW